MRDDVSTVAEAVLHERAGVVDPGVEVRTEALGKWGIAVVPAGSQDEWGTVFREVLNVGFNQLPPTGRLYVDNPA